ncbi:cytochrome-c oxidase [Nostoc sp. 3335mG]|nr:cytochrome-c oxidase [Nostoc sp. 3335mG]
MSVERNERRLEVRTYLGGYVAALGLTVAAFAIVHWRVAEPRTVFAIVLALGLVQIVVQFRCFLHIGLARSSRDDLQLILFSTLIVALMVGGTLVILFNLHGRMM